MKNYGLSEPDFYEERDSFKVIFRNTEIVLDQQVSEQVLRYRELVVKYCVTPKTAKEIREYLKMKSRNYASNNIIKPFIKEKMLEYTNKEHPNASNQKYITINNYKKHLDYKISGYTVCNHFNCSGATLWH